MEPHVLLWWAVAGCPGGEAETGSEQVLTEGEFGKNFICHAETREDEQGRVKIR